jgi:hypothetical protein
MITNKAKKKKRRKERKEEREEKKGRRESGVWYVFLCLSRNKNKNKKTFSKNVVALFLLKKF